MSNEHTEKKNCHQWTQTNPRSVWAPGKLIERHARKKHNDVTLNQLTHLYTLYCTVLHRRLPFDRSPADAFFPSHLFALIVWFDLENDSCHFTKLSIWFFFCKFDLCEIKSMTFDSICDRHSLVEKWNWNWISIRRIARNSIYMRSTEGNRDQNSNRHYDIHLYLQSNITSDELIE